jgi:hypothetical protein
MPDTEPKKRGRPKAKIDIGEIEKLAALGCTNEELAAWFGLGHGTIDRFIATKAGREAIERGRHKGRLSVRREQFKLLQAGNATMGIWLGKQLLGQRDYDRERIFRAIRSAGRQADRTRMVIETLAAASGGAGTRWEYEPLPIQFPFHADTRSKYKGYSGPIGSGKSAADIPQIALPPLVQFQ